LNNLLSNAIKYNRQGGRVTLTVGVQNGHVRLAVSDTGIGMTAQEAGQLFQEFYRVKNPHTRTILGSGLGLSIVKKVAVLYGGDVSVKSEPGVGSTFTVLLKRMVDTHPQDKEGGNP
ncbi:MAG TPA: ATP-binding protein, partial [Candidatus Methylomirabilis sp.]|nr:ATP-binding protein [Candidatus Methylomirabilis sp.]